MSDAPELTWQQLVGLLSPSGQQQLVDWIAEARRVRGAGWLVAIEQEFPLASWVIRLVMTKTDEEALTEICELYPTWPIRLIVGHQIKAMHAKLKLEIEKKR